MKLNSPDSPFTFGPVDFADQFRDDSQLLTEALEQTDTALLDDYLAVYATVVMTARQYDQQVPRLNGTVDTDDLREALREALEWANR